MDPAAASPDTHRSAANAESSSAHPQPFDDDDASSRKRQRTSVSGSSSDGDIGVDTLPTEPDFLTTVGSESLLPSLDMEDAEQPAPQTPERKLDSNHLGQLPSEPRSSRVTINIRNPANNDAMSSSTSTVSPSPHHRPSSSISDADRPQNSVEGGEADQDLTQAHDTGPETSKSSSDSASPTIELVVDDEDSDLDSDSASLSAAFNADDYMVDDPTARFPYQEAAELLEDAVSRVGQYFSSHSPIDNGVVDQVHSWLKLFLQFARNADAETLLTSCRYNRDAWSAFSEIMEASIARGPMLSRSHLTRQFAAELYLSLVRLTANFVNLDLLALEAQQSSNAPEIREIELFSTPYLTALHALTWQADVTSSSENEAASGDWREQLGGSSRFVRKLLSSLRYGLKTLTRLADALTGHNLPIPKTSECLAPLSQILADITRGSCRSFGLHSRVPSTESESLKLGHEMFQLLSEHLAFITEKHITLICSSDAERLIRALSDILRGCLHGEHEAARAARRTHQLSFPRLTGRLTIEAIMWEWRLEVLGKLVRSSQMQLRVMAVTKMCSDLVVIWKTWSDVSDEGQAFLMHLAQYLLQSGIIEYILGPNCHPEIVAESANIVGFLLVTKTYNAGHTNRLWQGITSSQDPRKANALIRMISTIISIFDYHSLLGLCRKFETLPIDGFVPAIRNLLDVVLHNMVVRGGTEPEGLGFEPYDLCVRLIRESSVCTEGAQVAYPETQKIALDKLGELLELGVDAQGKTRLYQSCIQDIASQSPTTLGSLWCLFIATRPAFRSDLATLVEHHDFSALIVGEIEHAIQLGRAAGVSSISGRVTQPRRDFVMAIIQNQPLSVANELGMKLWNILVGPESCSSEDRNAGWQILDNIARSSTLQNPFLRACLAEFLPTLPPSCFCEGMHNFIKTQLLKSIDEDDEVILGNSSGVGRNALEQLWRTILVAEDEQIVAMAVSTLAIDVYMESAVVKSSSSMAKEAHSILVKRCLRQFQEAARRIRASSEGSTSSDDESMIIVSTQGHGSEQERVFRRSLRLLRFFLESYQPPVLPVPDFCSPTSASSHSIEGELAQLSLQSFDGTIQTGMKPLSIGRLNTAASLLASIKQETGFENYRLYYRGRQFLPTEAEVCKSLEDLQIHDGLILVKRAESSVLSLDHEVADSVHVEVEIKSHFEEMWDYLSLDEVLAGEIYDFLLKFPANDRLMDAIKDNQQPYEDVFPVEQPFKTLYALYTLTEYINRAQPPSPWAVDNHCDAPSSSKEHSEILKRWTALILQAICDLGLVAGLSHGLRIRLKSGLMFAYIRLLKETQVTPFELPTRTAESSLPDRLMGILSDAAESRDDATDTLISSTLGIILQLGLLDHDFWSKISANDAFIAIMHNLALYNRRPSVQATLANVVQDAVGAEDRAVSRSLTSQPGSQNGTSHIITRDLWSFFSSLLPKLVQVPAKCKDIFRILEDLLNRICLHLPAVVDMHQLAGQVSQLLLDHVPVEDISEPEPYDPVVSGLANLLHACMQLEDSVALSPLIREDLAHELFWQLLFPRKREHTEQAVFKVVLNTSTRATLCDIVFHLIKRDPRKFKDILRSLHELVPFYQSSDDDPYHYELPYQFERSKTIRSSCGYVGLRNLSNTCYMNSLMTQLFMNPSFRCFILASDVRDPGNSQRLLFQTQKLFAWMQASYRRFVDPVEVVESITTYDDEPIDIHNQMDVDEFYNLLFDRWEAEHPSNDARTQLRRFYGGQLVQQVKSRECPHVSEVLEPFSAIQCDIKGKATLHDSLQAYVEGEVLEGDNKYKCSTCNRFVDATKRTCLKDVPDNLIFHLKRFDFNLRTLQRSKINDHFSFPTTIDMQPYTVEHLGNPSSGEKTDVFELVGILVHSGTAESGHYYSYIRERPTSPGRSSWLEFNDDTVRSWDPSEMSAATFGGAEHRPFYETNGTVYDKLYSAYMLFYERVSSLQARQADMSRQNLQAPLQVAAHPDLRDHIIGENNILLRRHCLFDHSHATFVAKCFNHAIDLDEESAREAPMPGTERDPEPPSPLHVVRALAMNVAIGHLDQIVSRAEALPDFTMFTAPISNALQRRALCALDYYNYFHRRPAALRAIVLRNPEERARRFAGMALINSARKISVELPHLYDPLAMEITSPTQVDGDRRGSSGSSRSRRETGVLEGVAAMLNYLFGSFHIHLRAWDEFFGTVLEFAKLGDVETARVLADDYLTRLMMIITADSVSDVPTNYARMLQNLTRRGNNRRPCYGSIIAAINFLMHKLEPILGPETVVDSSQERLEYVSPPFPWFTGEVRIVHQCQSQQPSLVFVDKLLALDQAPEQTLDIIRRLMGTDEQISARISLTLRMSIQGARSAALVDPYLRASVVYVQNSPSVRQAEEMIRQVSKHAGQLRPMEARAFLDFMISAPMHPPSDEEYDGQLRDFTIGLVPEWAPYLLAYPEIMIRFETRRFLDNVLFEENAGPSAASDAATSGTGATETMAERRRKSLAVEVIQRLGVSCLLYLRNFHVRRRAPILRKVAVSMLGMIERCQPYYSPDIADEDCRLEFDSLSDETVGPVQGLVAEELEEHTSERGGSGRTSEQVQDIAERGMQVVMNMDETEAAGED